MFLSSISLIYYLIQHFIFFSEQKVGWIILAEGEIARYVLKRTGLGTESVCSSCCLLGLPPLLICLNNVFADYSEHRFPNLKRCSHELCPSNLSYQGPLWKKIDQIFLFGEVTLFQIWYYHQIHKQCKRNKVYSFCHYFVGIQDKNKFKDFKMIVLSLNSLES